MMSSHPPQVVTASGAGRDGSMRVIRSGIGLTTLATLDLAPVQGSHGVYLRASLYDLSRLPHRRVFD
jgi:hypothetical protein